MTFEILSPARHFDLEAGEADMAFRPAGALSGDTLVATRLPAITWTVYRAATCDGGSGPTAADDLADHDVLLHAGTPGLEVHTDWLRSRASSSRIRGTANSPEDMVTLILSGLGVSVLPCFLGDATAGLRRCFAPPRDCDRP